MSRFIIAVLDSLGVGALPDAAEYNSAGANTLGHIAAAAPMDIPALRRLGIGNIIPLAHIDPVEQPQAAWGKMAAASAGMDTTSGHWEISGILLPQRLPTYPHGFPPEVTIPFCAAIGSPVLGNCVASGTQIIQELGTEHVASGWPIVYTSADSVFQIAAHEQVTPLERLYEMCRIARELLQGPHGVGRVIARPFLGNEREGYYRSENRRDFSLAPPEGSLLQKCRDSGVPVISIGKIFDVFAGQHIDRAYEGHNNTQSGESLLAALAENSKGLIFANFVDFDTEFGHRNDTEGYRRALESFDSWLPRLLAAMAEDDILAICGDHGNDPTTPGTDHCREYVPLLVYGARVRPISLGTRASFADLGQTAAEFLGAGPLIAGQSFLRDIIAGEEEK